MSGPWFALCTLLVVLVFSTNQVTAGDDKPQGQTGLAHGEFTVELNGLKLWYKVSGQGPVCLLPTPAWGPSSDLYFRTMKPLEKIFTIVYLDSRGTGRSGRAASTQEYTWDHLVADLDALRAHLKQERIWLMGHSEGGMQVLHYACKHPARVSGLILITTWGTADSVLAQEMGSRIQRRKNEPWFSEAIKVLQARFATDEEMKAGVKAMQPFYWSDPAKRNAFEADFAATSMSAVAQRGQTDSKRLPFDLAEQLSKIKAPALIVVGDDDFAAPPLGARRLHRQLANSKLLLIEKCGHFPWLEQPETFFTEVPAFLAALGLVR